MDTGRREAFNKSEERTRRNGNILKIDELRELLTVLKANGVIYFQGHGIEIKLNEYNSQIYNDKKTDRKKFDEMLYYSSN